MTGEQLSPKQQVNEKWNDVSSCAGDPTWETLSSWFPLDEQGPNPAGGSWESPPGPQEVPGVELSPLGMTALRGASLLSSPNSRLCSQVCILLIPEKYGAGMEMLKARSSRRTFTKSSCGLQSCRGIPCTIFFLFSKTAWLISGSIWSSSQLFQSLFPLLCITQHTSKCGASLVGGFSTAKCNDEPWGGPAFCLI